MINKFLETIKNSKNIAIISHINPDGDAIGSSMMLYEFLSTNFPDKNKQIFAEYKQLSKELSCILNYVQINQNTDNYYDLAICVDCGDKSQFGVYAPIFQKASHTINIDHHSANNYYGEINFVELISSNCENLYNILRATNLKLTPMLANYCYAGLLTDTNSLTNNNVTAKTYQTVAELICLGADVLNVRKIIFSGNSTNRYRLIARCMEKCEFLLDNRLLFVELTEKDFEEFGVFEEDIHGLISQIFTLDTGLAIAQVTPRNGLKHVSFRCKQGLDVSIIASALGGGGHICASACNTNLSTDEIRNFIVKEIEKQLENYTVENKTVFN